MADRRPKNAAQQNLQRVTAHFSGHVQGVGFRYTTQNIAQKYAVAGYVMNLPDGRVELVAEGDRRTLDALIMDVRNSMSRYIHDVSIAHSPAADEFGDVAAKKFEIRPY